MHHGDAALTFALDECISEGSTGLHFVLELTKGGRLSRIITYVDADPGVSATGSLYHGSRDIQTCVRGAVIVSLFFSCFALYPWNRGSFQRSDVRKSLVLAVGEQRLRVRSVWQHRQRTIELFRCYGLLLRVLEGCIGLRTLSPTPRRGQVRGAGQRCRGDYQSV